MRNKLILTLLLAGLMFMGEMTAQSNMFGFGFRAGLSFARLDGPSETGPDGASLEKYSMTNGFHIGATFDLRITDIMGLRSELMFSQRGTKYLYDGPSYYTLSKGTVQELALNGRRVQSQNVSNAYVDIPLLAWYKLGRFELTGGAYMGLLIASSGGGSIEFYGKSPVNPNDDLNPFKITLNHNYKSDKAGQHSIAEQKVTISGKDYSVPASLGAYYDFDKKDKNLYNALDFGWVIGASWYLNDNLYLGARYLSGFKDVDNNEYDISLQSLQNGQFVRRADANKSRSLQFSIGFSF